MVDKIHRFIRGMFFLEITLHNTKLKTKEQVSRIIKNIQIFYKKIQKPWLLSLVYLITPSNLPLYFEWVICYFVIVYCNVNRKI